MQARAVLIQLGFAKYAEQFEGMYVLMRGLVLTSLLSSAFVVGGSLELIRERQLHRSNASGIEDLFCALLIGGVIAAIIGLGRRIRSSGSLWRFTLLALGAYVAGVFMFWQSTHLGVRPSISLVAVGVVGLIDIGLGHLFERGYRHYADAFARTVYETFSVVIARERGKESLASFE